jgi:predicted nucleic acid-binding protein
VPVFVDTNVFVYARDASDIAKQQRALAWIEHLWRTADGRTGVQVLQEYYVTVTRKLSPGLPADDARADVADLWSWRPIPVQEPVLSAAWSIEDRFGLSFWDALIVAATREARCGTLLTEDLQHAMEIDGVRIVDPFLTDVGSLPPERAP